MRFQEVRGCTISCVLQHKTYLGRWMGKVCRATVSKRPQSWSDHARIGPALELTVQVSFSQLRRIQFLKQVLHESFDFTIARCASTKASVSQLQLAVLREVYENFVFRASTGSFRGKSCFLSFWRKSRTKASLWHSTFSFWGKSRTFSQLQIAPFESFWGKSTKASSSHLQLSVFEGNFKLKQQGCGNEFSLISRFLLPFIFLLSLFLQRYKGFKLVLFSTWCRDVPRSGFGADFGPEKTETIWEWIEKSGDEVRRAEKIREGLRWAEMGWVETTWHEKSGEEPIETRGWEKLGWHEKRWEQLRRAAKKRETWDEMRWGEVRWGEMRWKTLRRRDMRWNELKWDEMGWHRLGWQWDAMNKFREKIRCDETRWNEKKSTFKRDGAGMKSQEIVAAMHRRLGRTL